MASHEEWNLQKLGYSLHSEKNQTTNQGDQKNGFDRYLS